VPVGGVTLVPFAEIGGIAEMLASVENAVPEDAGTVVALTDIEALAEGSDDETVAPMVPGVEMKE